MGLLQEMYQFQDRLDLLAFLHVKQAYETRDFNERKEQLRNALALYKKANSFAAKVRGGRLCCFLSNPDGYLFPLPTPSSIKLGN